MSSVFAEEADTTPSKAGEILQEDVNESVPEENATVEDDVNESVPEENATVEEDVNESVSEENATVEEDVNEIVPEESVIVEEEFDRLENVTLFAAGNKSADFKIDELIIKIGVDLAYQYDGTSGTGTAYNLDLAKSTDPVVNVELEWSQKDVTQNNFVAGDYAVFEICTVSGNTAAYWADLTENIQLVDTIDKNTVLGYGSLIATDMGDGTIKLSLKVVFNENIVNKYHIGGDMSGSATVKGLAVDDTIVFTSSGEEKVKFADFEKVVNPNAGTGYINNSLTDPSSSKVVSSIKNGTEKLITWRIYVRHKDLISQAFNEYQTGTTASSQNYLILEETLDMHQSFYDSSDNLNLSLNIPYWLYDSEEPNYSTKYYYVTVEDKGAFLKKMTKIDTGNNATTEAAVRSTPLTYTVLVEPDPDNQGYSRERLVMNFGEFGHSGLRYTDVFTAGEIQGRIKAMQDRADICAAALADNPTAANSDKIAYYNAGDNKTYTYTKETFILLERLYNESAAYYSVRDGEGNGPYIPTFELCVSTRVLVEESATCATLEVKNSYSVAGAFAQEKSTTTQDNFWTANIRARLAENGEVQLFKADSLYGNTAGDKDDGIEVEGFMGDVCFKVYAASDTNAESPLTFEYSSTTGVFTYNASGTVDSVTTDSGDGSVILSGLPDGDYFFKETAAPDGYYTGQNPKIKFTVSSTAPTYKLANNDARGVTLQKVDAEDDTILLADATFALYKLSEGELYEEVTGFTNTEINGTNYLVYDGTGPATLTTGSDGKLNIIQLPAGSYYLVEIDAPDEYEVSETEYAFILNESLADGASAILDLGQIKNSKPTVERTVIKVWDDEDNHDGLRPTSIEVQLKADGEVYRDAVALNAGNNWEYTWSGLPEKQDGEPVVYTVEETGVPAGYTSGSVENDGIFTITNSHTPAVTERTVTKKWNDADNQDGFRPDSVTVHLKADGVLYDTVTLDESSSWTHTWTSLPLNNSGEEIRYTVVEDNVDGYTTSYSESGTEFTIMNSYTPGVVSKTVSKNWADNYNQDGSRPDSIEVQLFADGAACGSPVKLNANDGWAYTWKELDKMCNGNSITYSVKEITEAAGYKASYSDDTFTITNTHTPGTVTTTSTKTGDTGNIGLWIALLSISIAGTACLLWNRRGRQRKAKR